jgi:hypothetical protein
MTWKDNALMFWSTDGTTWTKVTDHNRDPLSISYERLEKRNRMADGTLRRYTVGKKRTFSADWNMLPAKRNTTYGGRVGITTVDNGLSGEEIEAFYNTVDGAFFMKLRKGQDESKAIADGTIEVITVMITDFSKEITKRGVNDYWSISITLEEV